MPKENVCLIVIDGWGISDNDEGNAIKAADTPVMDALSQRVDQNLTLNASGLSVGLPAGLMGNSEVGHLNIGAGRVVYQDIVRINMDVEKNRIKDNPNFVEACRQAKESGGRLHLMGLVSDGGVHAHINHLFALLEAAKNHQVPNTYIHFISDGRDTLPQSGVGYIQQVIDKIKALGYGTLTTITGRYYAMDRDKRWERIKVAYEGLTQGIGEEATLDNVIDVVKKRYDSGENDEFLKPIILNKEGLIRDNDTLVTFNYRSDRMRQISETLGVQFNFETDKKVQGLKIITMTKYKSDFPFPNLYPPEVPKNVLAEALANANLRQFHCAETEKYAHVTFFFNGGQEAQFPGEDRFMVPSPKVPTYDHQPEMSCMGVAEKMAEMIGTKKFPFVMCNFAPPDMVGHTGKYEPAVKACTATDKAIGVIKDACEKNGYVLLVTSDHGNAEQMIDPKTKGEFTAHTSNRVPFYMTGNNKFDKVPEGYDPALCDVAPTVLHLIGVPQPAEMTGKSLVVA